MIDSWIDEVAKAFEIHDGRFGTVRSIRLMEKAEFPDSIDASELERSPLALTIPGSLQVEYSTGGPVIGYWTGVTEIHVSPDLDRTRLPSLLKWYQMIASAVSSHMKLNNTVELFLLADREDAIAGPLPMQYGSEPQHWGFLVQWQVKERLEGEITVSA